MNTGVSCDSDVYPFLAFSDIICVTVIGVFWFNCTTFILQETTLPKGNQETSPSASKHQG